MDLRVQIDINKELYLRDPEGSELGKKIIHHSIQLIYKLGFESFTFRKLAEEIGSTEASVYRYFENKHRLLLYLVTWYWGWLSFQIDYQTNNIESPFKRINMIIEILSRTVEDDMLVSHVNESILHKIVISEGSKVFLTNHVDEDNKHQFFKPYKDLCASICGVISECNLDYKYPRSLATTIIEMAHIQNYFMSHLPALTDFAENKLESEIISFLKDLVFNSIGSESTPVE